MAFIGGIGPWEWGIVLVVLLILAGFGKLGVVMRSFGDAAAAFRDAASPHVVTAERTARSLRITPTDDGFFAVVAASAAQARVVEVHGHQLRIGQNWYMPWGRWIRVFNYVIPLVDIRTATAWTTNSGLVLHLADREHVIPTEGHHIDDLQRLAAMIHRAARAHPAGHVPDELADLVDTAVERRL